jgi:predicted RNA binding protein YcfA (HicA-like mRNA interferase family)
MRNNLRDWSIEDLKSLAKRWGVDVDHDGTSHVVFRHPTAGRLVVPAARPIKPFYIRLFLTYIDKLEEAQ